MLQEYNICMGKILVGLAVVLSFFTLSVSRVDARTSRVRGYYKRSTGSYVMPHYKTTPNSYKWDNYSSRGNYNPYTAKRGYKSW